LSHIVSSTKTELKAGAIHAITKIIQIEVFFYFLGFKLFIIISIFFQIGEISTRNDMIARTHKWYKQMKDNPIKNIVYTSCVMPFLDIQRAGFEMLLALAEQPWGQEEINKFPCKFI